MASALIHLAVAKNLLKDLKVQNEKFCTFLMHFYG